ncbi:MAG: tryptophan synthase subunit alpha [Chlamydiales bacterium]|nr:tryptophan synthase subunit alpha [Chlamydiales bacterium]
MSRIAKCFEGKKPFIGYITAGDGGMARTLDVARALVEGGVDLLEVGIPFTDPVADGPVIQQAMTRSLEEGTTPEKVLDFVKAFRKESEVPIVLFSYFNPLFVGGKSFLEKAAKVGVDGILVVDLSLEEGEDYMNEVKRVGIDPIFLISPSTPQERIKKIAERGRGFLYYVCRKGTTGVKQGFPEDLEEKVKGIKACSALPVAIGFGIATKEMAKRAMEVADGCVVGSVLVEAIGQGKSSAELTQLAQGIKA